MDIKPTSSPIKRKNFTSSDSKTLKKGFASLAARFEKKANTWLKWSVALLILAVLLCLGLWGARMALDKKSSNLAVQKEELEAERKLDLEEDFTGLKKRIEILKLILNNRKYPSRVFQMLEELTLPQVQFMQLDTDLAKAEVILIIESSDYTTLAKQVAVFEDDSRIKNIELSEVELKLSGRIGSNLKIGLDQDFLRTQE